MPAGPRSRRGGRCRCARPRSSPAAPRARPRARAAAARSPRGRGRVPGLERREHVRQPVDDQLVEALGPVEPPSRFWPRSRSWNSAESSCSTSAVVVLETRICPPWPARRRSVRPCARRSRRSRRRWRGSPRRCGCPSGPGRRWVRPGLVRERALPGDRGRIAPAALEDGEERVALAVDLEPAHLEVRIPQELVVAREHLAVALPAHVLQELRRALDVREQKVTVPVGSSVTSYRPLG